MPFILLNTAERLPLEYEGATIYYHRLTYQERRAVSAESTERGLTDLQALWLLTSQRAVDAWAHVYDADLKPVAVPGAGEGQRAAIAAIVEHFPPEGLQRIAGAALSDAPEEIKKNYAAQYPDGSPLPIGAPALNLPVAPVGPNAATSSC